MVGLTGRLRGIPKPSETVTQEALNLLSVMGGGSKAANKLLQEMKDTQTNNESVLREALAIIGDLDKREKELNTRELELIEQVNAAEKTIAKKFQDIANEEDALDNRANNENEDLNARKSLLDAREKEIENARISWDEFKSLELQKLQAREDALNGLELNLKEEHGKLADQKQKFSEERAIFETEKQNVAKYKSQLEEREGKLRNFLGMK